MSKKANDGKKARAASQRSYEQRMRGDGFVRVCTWVPGGDVETFKASVERLKKRLAKV